MKKRILSTVVAFSIALSLAACGGGTYESEPEPRRTATTEPPAATTEPPAATTEPPATTTEPPATTTEPPVSSGEVRLSLDKSVYARYETITATVGGFTEEMVDAKAFVAIYPVGADNGDYGQYKYPYSYYGEEDRELEFLALDTGDYEMRVYTRRDMRPGDDYAVSVSFTVDVSLPEAGTGGPSATSADGVIFMGVDKAVYAPREAIKVTVRGLPEDMYGAYLSVAGENYSRSKKAKPYYDEIFVSAPYISTGSQGMSFNPENRFVYDGLLLKSPYAYESYLTLIEDNVYEIALHERETGDVIVSVRFSVDEALIAPGTGGGLGPGDDSTVLPPQIIITREKIEFAGESWLVLEEKDGMVLVVSEYVLDDGKKYHEVPGGTSEYVTWETCTLRDWLNGEYYNGFSDADKAKIVKTTVINKDNPWFCDEKNAGEKYEPLGGNDTEDYIFLLSLEEVVEYFGDSGQLANRPENAHEIADKYSANRLTGSKEGGNRYWWLRSPGNSARHAAVQYIDGALSVGGQEVNGRNGVRPAMWLNL
jgi:hypothetical protein